MPWFSRSERQPLHRRLSTHRQRPWVIPGATAAALSLLYCAASPSGGSTAKVKAAVPFSFPLPDGAPVTSSSTRGRATVLAFITMYDLASQVMVRRLGDVLRSFRPRANAAAIVLEAPQYSELIPAYATAMQLPYPVAMANFDILHSGGPFSEVNRVPTLIFLDKSGREVLRRTGDLSVSELVSALEAATGTNPEF